MFENVPKAAPQPVAQPAPGQAPPTKSGLPPSIAAPTLGIPPPAVGVLADQATIEMFKRTGLNAKQKIIVVIITIVVLVALVGGGIWIYLALDPGSGGKTDANRNNANEAISNVPLQELDTDKDGVRDIDEKRYNTDVNLTDTDADGLSDYLEIFQYKTDPTLADTDGDSYQDGNEVTNGYDPNGPGKLEE